ncbi:MAG TPA: peptidyl-prolyl cis-trans isomerase [Chromatiales bacterium]|nr:peptidyl-prolyl cis-trans isomerase [Chromatiales bacterium]
MKRIIPLLGLLLALSFALPGQAAGSNPQVEVETSLGSFVLELYPDKAPSTVANFLDYVNSGFYNGTLFHRVIDGFMIQGGGFTEDYQRKQTNPAIMNEADNGLKNERGTIAMARTGDPHSATSQFFINVSNNDFLNHTAKSPRGWGYTVFGKVIKGMDTVDKIRKVKTGPGGPFPKDAPRTPVVIKSMSVIGATPTRK